MGTIHIERALKKQYLPRLSSTIFFWKTYDGQEIDLIESHNGKLKAFECKWKNSRAKKPVAFDKAYPDAAFMIVNQDNYLDVITGNKEDFSANAGDQ